MLLPDLAIGYYNFQIYYNYFTGGNRSEYDIATDLSNEIVMIMAA